MATSPKSRGRKSGTKNGKQPVEEVPEEAPASEQEDDEEEGYEVEAILDAKWAFNKRGKWSYFVHWKGYGSDEDMWIDEDDAGGAEDLIIEWHEANDLPRDGKGKKKSAMKKPRGSAAATVKDKKRKASSTDGMEVDSPEAEAPPAKKPAKRSAKPQKPEPEQEEVELEGEDEDAIEFQSIDDILKMTRWDDIIEKIETVDRLSSNDDELVALFLRKDGHKSKCSTVYLAERCPQLLIKFYEGHLKWRPSDEADEADE